MNIRNFTKADWPYVSELNIKIEPMVGSFYLHVNDYLYNKVNYDLSYTLVKDDKPVGFLLNREYYINNYLYKPIKELEGVKGLEGLYLVCKDSYMSKYLLKHAADKLYKNYPYVFCGVMNELNTHVLWKYYGFKEVNDTSVGFKIYLKYTKSNPFDRKFESYKLKRFNSFFI